MSITKSLIVLGLSMSTLSLVTTACGSHEEAVQAMNDAIGKSPMRVTVVPSPKPSASPAASGPCAQRDAELKDLEDRAQSQLEQAVHRSFQGLPISSANTLRTSLAAIESKYQDKGCDAATLRDARDQITRTSDEIDQLPR